MRRTVLRRGIVVLATLAGGCAPVRELLSRTPEATVASMPSTITILRDERGVAHVYGPTDASVAFGAAFAQAEDDYVAIEDGTARAIGRAANLYGELELSYDLVRAAFDVERRARAEYAAEPPDRRAIWDAFAAGLNHYAATPGAPRRLIGTWEPWMLFARFLATPGVSATHDSAGVVQLTAFPSADTVASIAWAIAGSRSATAAPLLLFSSYGPFEGSERPYEMHVESGEGWSFRGAMRLGTPVPYAAFNAHGAWGITQRHDAIELVALDATKVVERLDTVRINTMNGVQPRVLRFRSTANGAVIAQDGTLREGAWPHGGGMQLQYALSRAATPAAFEAVRSATVDVIHADASGAIAHSRRGVATRAEGGWIAVGNVATSPAQDSSWTLDELAAASFDTRIEGAESEIDALVLEWEQVGGTNPARASRVDAALDTLRAWNRAPVLTTTGASLFMLWRARLAEVDGAFARFRAFEDVVARYPGGVRPWSEINVLRRAGAKTTLPATALPRVARSMTRLDALPAAGAGDAGNAWVLVVQAGAPDGARTISANGQSGDSASGHYFDQAAWYARGALRPAWFGRDSVQAHAARTYRPDAVR